MGGNGLVGARKALKIYEQDIEGGRSSSSSLAAASSSFIFIKFTQRKSFARRDGCEEQGFSMHWSNKLKKNLFISFLIWCGNLHKCSSRAGQTSPETESNNFVY